MTHERFEQLLDELDGDSLSTLKAKNKMYSSSNDALHNFISGANIGGCTAAQACWGYLVKHLVALRDKILNNDFSDEADLKEKCQDSINYIRFIWAIAHEGETRVTFNNDIFEDERTCENCEYSDVDFGLDGISWGEPCNHCRNTALRGTPEYESRLFLWAEKDGK